MSNPAINWAWKQNCHGDLMLRTLLVALCDHARKDSNICWPSQESLAQKLMCSVRTVQRKLAQLERLGYIQQRQRARQTSIYLILLGKSSMTRQHMSHHQMSLNLADSGPFSPTHDTTNRHDDPTPRCRTNPNINPKEDSNALSRAQTYEPAEPVDEPPKARLFRKGKTALVMLGLSEERSGAVIGRWLKDKYDPTGILAAIEYAREQCAVSPIAYVTQILRGQKHEKTDFQSRVRELSDEARRLEDQAGVVRSSDAFRGH